MAINAVCPSCGNVHQLADSFSFKTVECSQCGTVFPTPAKKVAGPPPLPPGFVPPTGAPKPEPAPVASGEYEVLPDEEESPAPSASEEPQWEVMEEPVREEIPRRSKVKRVQEKEEVEDDEDEVENEEDEVEDDEPVEEEEEGLSRRFHRGEDDADEETDEDEYEVVKSRTPLMLGLAAVFMLLIGGGAAVYFFVLKDDKPVVAEKTDTGEGDGKTEPQVDPGTPRPVNPKPKKEVPKAEEKKDEPKVDEPKKEDPKTDEPKMEEPKKEVPKKEPPKKEVPKKEEPKKPSYADGAVLVNAAQKVRPIDEYKPAGDRAELLAAGVIKDVCAAGGGRYLLVNCAESMRLQVVDVSAGKIAKTITLTAADALVAGGMDHFVVVYPGQKTVERFSLDTMASEASAKIDARQKIIAAEMGCRTAGPVVLGGPMAQNNASKMALMFIDLPTLKEVVIEKAEGDMRVVFSTAAHLRVSPNGQLLGAWFDKLNPTGLQTVQLAGNTLRGAYASQSVGPVAPGADGESVYTAKGKFGPGLQNPAEAGVLVPAVTGKWVAVLDVTKTDRGDDRVQKITVREEGKPDALAVFDTIPGFVGKRDAFERDVNPLTTDRRIWLVPEAKVMVTIPPAANKIQFFAVKGK